jgi:hypothetical protein
MNDFPEPPSRTVATGGQPGPAVAASGERGEPKELKVPRSIVRWSKWRKAALRAEHRETRRNLQGSQAKPVMVSEPLAVTEDTIKVRDAGSC